MTKLSKLVATVPEPMLRNRLVYAVGVMKNTLGMQMGSAIHSGKQYEIIQTIFDGEVPSKSSFNTICEKGLFVEAPITEEILGKNSKWTWYKPEVMLTVIAFLHVKRSIEKSVGHDLSYQVAILETIRQLGFEHPLVGSFEENVLDEDLIKTHREETDFATIVDELEKIHDQQNQTKKIRQFIVSMWNVLENSSYFPATSIDIVRMTFKLFSVENDEQRAYFIYGDTIKRSYMPDGIELNDGEKRFQAYYPRDLLALWLYLRLNGVFSPEREEKRTHAQNMEALEQVISLVGEKHPIALRYKSSELSYEEKLNRLSRIGVGTLKKAVGVLTNFPGHESVGAQKMDKLGIDLTARQALFEMWRALQNISNNGNGKWTNMKKHFADLTVYDYNLVLNFCIAWLEEEGVENGSLRDPYNALFGEPS